MSDEKEIPEELRAYLPLAQTLSRVIGLVLAAFACYLSIHLGSSIAAALGYALLTFVIGNIASSFFIGMALFPIIKQKQAAMQEMTHAYVTIVAVSETYAAKYMDTSFPEWIDVKGSISGQEEKVYRLKWDGIVEFDHDLSQYKGQIAIIAYGGLYRGDIENKDKSFSGSMNPNE